MTKEQKETVNRELVLLDKKDVMELTGWCESVTNRIFAYDKDMPAIKVGKKYQVELSAFKKYLSERRTKEK